MHVVELAKKTGYSIDIVKYRLKTLNSIVNSFRIILDLNKIGFYHYVILLQIRQSSSKDEQRLIGWCSLKQNVIFLTKRIGQFDYEINVAIQTINDLNNFIHELKSEFGGIIKSYESIVNSKLLKLNYFPGDKLPISKKNRAKFINIIHTIYKHGTDCMDSNRNCRLYSPGSDLHLQWADKPKEPSKKCLCADRCTIEKKE